MAEHPLHDLDADSIFGVHDDKFLLRFDYNWPILHKGLSV